MISVERAIQAKIKLIPERISEARKTGECLPNQADQKCKNYSQI